MSSLCRLLAKRHTDVARWWTKLCCRLQALIGELVPGGIDKEVVVPQARSCACRHLACDDAAALERHRQVVELIDEIEHLDVVPNANEGNSDRSAAVAASGTTLTDIFGVGPIVACNAHRLHR